MGSQLEVHHPINCDLVVYTKAHWKKKSPFKNCLCVSPLKNRRKEFQRKFPFISLLLDILKNFLRFHAVFQMVFYFSLKTMILISQIFLPNTFNEVGKMSVRLMEINTLSFASRTFQIRSCFWKALRYLAPKQVNFSLFFFLIFFFFFF